MNKPCLMSYIYDKLYLIDPHTVRFSKLSQSRRRFFLTIVVVRVWYYTKEAKQETQVEEAT